MITHVGESGTLSTIARVSAKSWLEVLAFHAAMRPPPSRATSDANDASLSSASRAVEPPMRYTERTAGGTRLLCPTIHET